MDEKTQKEHFGGHEYVGLREESATDPPTPRDLAMVYLFASSGGRAVPGAHAEALERALTRVAVAAGEELVPFTPEPPSGFQEVFAAAVERVERATEERAETGGPIAQGPDGEPHQDRPGPGDVERMLEGFTGHAWVPEERIKEAEEIAVSRGQQADAERERYLALASTVLDAATSIYRIAVAETGGPATPREAILREVRTLAAAITEESLLARIDLSLPPEEEGTPDPPEETRAEMLARFILERQIDAGEATVPWDTRGASRGRRVGTARLILEKSEEMADRGERPGTRGWLTGVGGALSDHDGMEPNAAIRVARWAGDYLRAEEECAEAAVDAATVVPDEDEYASYPK